MSEALPRTPSFRLDGRRALVTGAGRGIGLAAASALSQAGAMASGCIGRLRLEPSASAWPHQAIALSGSRRADSRNARTASGWLKA